MSEKTENSTSRMAGDYEDNTQSSLIRTIGGAHRERVR